jgi:hypothetical protein
MTPSNSSSTKPSIRAALYERISTLNTAKTLKSNFENFATTAIDVDSRLLTLSWTGGSAVLGREDQHSTG